VILCCYRTPSTATTFLETVSEQNHDWNLERKSIVSRYICWRNILDLGQHILKMILHYSAGWYLQSVNDSWRSVKWRKNSNFTWQIDRSQVSAKILRKNVLDQWLLTVWMDQVCMYPCHRLEHLKICLRRITKHCICLFCLTLFVTPGYTHRPHQPMPLAQQGSVELRFWASKPLFGICPLLFRLSVQQWVRVVPKMQTQDGVCPGKFYIYAIKHWHWWSPANAW